MPSSVACFEAHPSLLRRAHKARTGRPRLDLHNGALFYRYKKAHMIERDMAFEGIDNFRDYGGYQTPAGRLRMGRLFRSAHHGSATDQDLSLLSELNLHALFDLRAASERAFAPSRRPEAFRYSVLEVDLGDTAGVSHDLLKSLRSAQTNAEARRFYAQSYAQLAVTPALIGAFRSLFAVMAGGGASVVHCNAGKDRTGIACALAQRAMGVHEDDIMEDYLLTNTVRGAEQRLALNSFKLRAVLGQHIPDDVIEAYSIVTPEYLHAAFAAIEARAGGWEAYLRDDLGADGQWRTKAEQTLLE